MVAKFIRFRHPCLGTGVFGLFWWLHILIGYWAIKGSVVMQRAMLVFQRSGQNPIHLRRCSHPHQPCMKQAKAMTHFDIHHVLVNLQYHALWQSAWSICIYRVFFQQKYIKPYHIISYRMSTYVVSTVLTQLPHIHQVSSHGKNVVTERYWEQMWLKCDLKTGGTLQASSSSSSLSSALSPHNEATRDQRWKMQPKGWITKSSSVHIDFFGWLLTSLQGEN